jgi:hypothetical protein
MIPCRRLQRSIANRAWVVNLVAVAAAIAAAPARAHPEFAQSTVNRYVKLDLLSPNELRLAYTIMVGPGPAAVARRAADRDGNGHVDSVEARALGERTRAAAVAGIALTVDGARIVPAFAAPEVGLAGDEVAPSPFSVDLIARVPLVGNGPHTVSFDDATPEPLLGDTEVRIEESPTTHLAAAHRGPTGDERQSRFEFRGPKFSALEDRSITLVFTAGTHARATATRAPSSRSWPYALLVLSGIALVAVLVRRRYRNM